MGKKIKTLIEENSYILLVKILYLTFFIFQGSIEVLADPRVFYLASKVILYRLYYKMMSKYFEYLFLLIVI